MKLFSVRVKELFEPIVLKKEKEEKKKPRQIFALFNSIFFGNPSFSNGGPFYGKKRKVGKENRYLTENRLD